MQGRCIAGIHFASGQWIRPVSRCPNRELYERHYQLPSPWGAARVLDTVQIGFISRLREPHHPEDCLIDCSRWTMRQRPESPAELRQLREQLTPLLYQQEYLFGSPDDCVPSMEFANTPAQASLALIHPSAFSWHITLRDEKRRHRVCFTYRGHFYNIGLTDPCWEQRLAQLPFGSHAPAATGIAPGSEIWLTVSLGEPFHGDCYKLAAAVIVWPRE
jgi:hypothetical protein